MMLTVPAGRAMPDSAPVPSAVPAVRRNPHFDALRGGAALLVMFGHTRGIVLEDWTVSGHATRWAPLYFMAGFGRRAVVVFFLLSGLLVAQSVRAALRTGRWALGHYVTERWIRLAVVAYPALVCGYWIDWIGLHAVGYRSVYRTGTGPLWSGHVAEHSHLTTYLGNAAFLQTILVPPAGSNVSLWSLCNEFCYYIAFGLVVHACFAPTSRATRLSCAAGAATMLCLTALPGGGISSYSVSSEVLPMTGIWVLGVLISVLINRWDGVVVARAWWLVALALAGAVTVGLRIWIVPPRERYLADYAQALATAPLLLLMGLRGGCEASRGYARCARWAAAISFSLYATHLPLIHLIMGMNYERRVLPSAYTVAVLAVMTTACVAYAWAFHWAFERHTPRLRAGAKRMLRALDGDLPAHLLR
jgi:peptidoglycan/LPS O-acetylase OafA/YrhL